MFRLEHLQCPVDVPFASGEAILLVVEVERTTLHAAPVGLADDRNRNHQADFPPVFRLAEFRGGLTHRLVEQMGRHAGAERLVQPSLPLLLPGSVVVARFTRMEQTRHLEMTVVGSIVELQEQERIEQPVSPSRGVPVGDVGSALLPVPGIPPLSAAIVAERYVVQSPGQRFFFRLLRATLHRGRQQKRRHEQIPKK